MRKALSGSLVCGLVLFAALVSLPVIRPGLAPRLLPADATRPHYNLTLSLDYELLTFQASARIAVPADTSDPVSNVVLFLHANARSMVAGEGHKNIVVDRVFLKDEPVPFKLENTVLRAELPQPQSSPFELAVNYHGVVPRAADSSGTGGLGGLLGTSSSDLTRMLQGSLGGSNAESQDYGLYSYGQGILSLGSFWYPQLAVRQDGWWKETEAPAFGDMAYAECGDFDVRLAGTSGAVVAASGEAKPSPEGGHYTARDVRDFALILSQYFVIRSQTVEASERPVTLTAYLTPANQARLDRVIDIGAEAVKVFSRRFGPYPYRQLKIVEAPIRGGAGGMEYSGLTAIAPMVLQDWEKELKTLQTGSPLGALGSLLSGLSAATGAPAAQNPGQAPSQNPLAGLFQGLFDQQNGMLGSLLEMTIAHEVAHQWWGMSVGSDSVLAPFVDESLTNYSAIIYFEDRYGKELASRMEEMHLRTPYSMGRMLGMPDAPADLPTSGYASSIQYGAVVYGKGALYYDALRKAVGDEAFFGALRDYYRTYQGRLAGPKALLDIMRKKAPQAGVDTLYRRWIEERHGDEDISSGNLLNLGDLLKGLLSGLGNPGAAQPPPKPR